MKQFWRIFILITSCAISDTTDSDVKHMLVDYSGKTKSCFIDSISSTYIYFVLKDSVDTDSLRINDIYYAYNDFDRVFHYSWSFQENLRRMENRAGKVITINGDTLNYTDIEFNNDMMEPEVFIKINKELSENISMFDVHMIETDYSIMDYSVRRGFYYSFYSFFTVTIIDILLNWDSQRRVFPQVWDQYNDLFPMITVLGLNKKNGTGVTYEALTSLIPASVILSMVYDIIKQKNKFYFTPIFSDKEFGRKMYVFTFSNYVKSTLQKNRFLGKVLGLIR